VPLFGVGVVPFGLLFVVLPAFGLSGFMVPEGGAIVSVTLSGLPVELILTAFVLGFVLPSQVFSALLVPSGFRLACLSERLLSIVDWDLVVVFTLSFFAIVSVCAEAIVKANRLHSVKNIFFIIVAFKTHIKLSCINPKP
jgi:hypothetical protein